MSTETLFDETLALPVEQRLWLIETLLTSLNSPVEEDLERLWAEEAERRVKQIESGEARLIPGEQAFACLRAKYAK